MQTDMLKPPAPASPQPASCENCGAPLYGKYCYACGQPTTGMVRHFSSVMSDIADSVLNIDERVFKTLGPLYFRPGRLTLDYFAGRRARYVTPFRLVFFLAIVAFFSTQITVRAGSTPATKAVAVSASDGTPSVAVVPASKGLPAPISSDAGAFANGNISINDKVLWNRDTRPLKIGWLPDAAVDWINDLIGNAQQQLHAMNAGSWDEQQSARRKFTLGMYSAAPTVLFVLLPIFALLLKIFYIFKRRLYMEHLIVAMHSHAFLMLSMLVLVLIGVLRHLAAPHGGWASIPFVLFSAAAWIWIFVYLWLMQKRVYRQGWFMTNVKYWSLGFCYTILLGFGFVFVMLLSLTSA
ncbi:MAG TPA: DUF3667 domain-containing protein [Rhodanobacteraceae bacterium]|nr:DUF3667 domain-containing protein [Rhodanobacteraceae bacterium]